MLGTALDSFLVSLGDRNRNVHSGVKSGICRNAFV